MENNITKLKQIRNKKTKNTWYSFFASIIIGLIASGIFCSGVYVFAVSSGTATVDRPYDPGEVLSPTCAPGSSYCTVAVPEIISNRFKPNGYPGLDENGDLVGIFMPRSITSAEITAGTVVLEAGEIAITNDTYQIFVGDNSGYPVNISPVTVPYTGATSNINLGSLSLEADGGILSVGVTDGYTIPSGSGTRIMWVPSKGAFRAGKIIGFMGDTQWDMANLGNYSTAFSYETIASGDYSTASGFGSTASGIGSIAFGNWTTASGNYSIAFGSTASGNYSTAFGNWGSAMGEGSMASGESATSSGTSSVAIGQYMTAQGYGSVAIGYSAGGTFVAGTGTANVGYGQVAMGYASTGTLKATGTGSVAMGQDVNATTNDNVLAFGKTFTATTANSFNIGFGQLDYELTATAADFKDSSFTTTGKGTLTGGVVSSYAAVAPTYTTNGQIGVAYVGTSNRIYFYSNSGLHYVTATAGFEIPGYETNDPVTGEKMQVGDFVLGMINQNQGDGDTTSDSSLHGIWVKWSSVKAQLLAELSGSTATTWSGAVGTGTVSTIDTTTLTDKVTNVFVSFGVSVKNGVTNITKIKIANAKIANINNVQKLQSVDQTTGEVYCTWISNGEWQKAKGECSSTAVSTATTTSSTEQALAIAQQAAQSAQEAAQSAAQAEQVAESTTQLNITSISAITDITVDYGTIPTLPEIVAVTLSDGITANPAVSWDAGTPTFDSNTAGTYVFNGTPTLASSITNTDNLTATVNVIVSPQPEQTTTTTEETPTTTETPSAGELIQDATSSLLDGMWRFIQWLFGTTINFVKK